MSKKYEQTKKLTQLLYFFSVGSTAALIHWLVAIYFIKYTSVTPLFANFYGYLIAFTVSFIGHYSLTFKEEKAEIFKSVYKFFIVSLMSFILNQFLFWLGLNFTNIHPKLLLVMVLITVAIVTFIVAKIWAFRKSHTNE